MKRVPHPLSPRFLRGQGGDFDFASRDWNVLVIPDPSRRAAKEILRYNPAV
jgi:hypothetical protein